MSSDVMSILSLDKTPPNGKLILVKEHSGCEANFILSCIMMRQIRNKNSVCLLTFHNTIEHYHNVGLRLGYNFKNSMYSGVISVIDGTSWILNSLNSKDSSMSISLTDAIANQLLLKFENAFEEMSDKHESICIVIDDITHMLDLGISLSTLNDFVQYIINSLNKYKKSFALLNCHISSHDDESNVIAGLISHKAHTVVAVTPLKTGRSADVSGHIVIKHPGHKFDEEKRHSMSLKQENYHYKLFDRGVKFFAPGTVSFR